MQRGKYIRTLEIRKKNSLANKGKVSSFKNKKHSEETKKIMSEIAKLRKRQKHSDETKKKIRETDIKTWANPILREKDRQRMLGEKNPCWCGGYSFNPYPTDFKRVKEKIRQRDGFICQFPECSETDISHKLKIGKFLTVHHINHIRDDIREENLITLCLKHNIKANVNRKFWIKFYDNLLFKKLNKCAPTI